MTRRRSGRHKNLTNGCLDVSVADLLKFGEGGGGGGAKVSQTSFTGGDVGPDVGDLLRRRRPTTVTVVVVRVECKCTKSARLCLIPAVRWSVDRNNHVSICNAGRNGPCTALSRAPTPFGTKIWL